DTRCDPVGRDTGGGTHRARGRGCVTVIARRDRRTCGGIMKARKPLVEIVATGRYLPERVLTNADLEKMVDTTDEWITERTGIRERRIADADMGAADMGARAARIAMERANVQPGEVDMVIVSTATPDRLLRS